MKVILEGKPIAKMRARHSRRGHIVVTYDPQQDDKEYVKRKFEKALIKALNSEIKSEVLDASQITASRAFEVDFWFYLPVSKSDSIADKNGKLWGFELANCKPDYDNLEKFYLDCANGILWPDDSMIVDAHSHKRYDENPRMEVTIMPKKPLKLHEKAEAVIKNFSPNQLKMFLYDVRKLIILDPDGADSLSGQDLEMWLSASACLISEFANKYFQIFKDIQKKTGGDISSEVKNYLELKSSLEGMSDDKVKKVL